MLRGGIALCPTTDDGPQAVLPQAMHDTEILGMGDMNVSGTIGLSGFRGISRANQIGICAT
jgi:hypothetical protein